jgi:uncharacterized membrane protein
MTLGLYSLSAERKLRAARLRQHAWDLVQREQLRPRLRKQDLFLLEIILLRCAWVHPIRASRIPATAHVDETFTPDAGAGQTRDHFCSIVTKVLVVVPGLEKKQ